MPARSRTLAGAVRALWGRLGMAAARALHYRSTYCLHGSHRDCRRTCKHCGSPCRCPCHQEGTS